MNKALAAIVAVAGTAGVANAQNYLAVESFSGLSASGTPADIASGSGTVSSTPGETIAGTPDIDAAGQYNSSYEYGPYVQVVADSANDFPNSVVADDNYIINTGAVDHFFRVFADTAIANTTPNLNVAFAFAIDSRGAAVDQNIDLWRFLDDSRTGGTADMAVVRLFGGDIEITQGGIPTTVVGDSKTLDLDKWYIFVLSYKRNDGIVDSYIIDPTDGSTTTLTQITGVTPDNTNAFATLATGATLAAPIGGSDITVLLDDVAIYDSSDVSVGDDSTLLSNIASDFSITTNVSDWSLY